MDSINNSITVPNFESWFIVTDILMIVSLILSILLAVIYLATVILNKTCHRLPMVLTSNSCLVEILYGCDMLSIAAYTLEKDMKQMVFQDTFCAFRDYLGYVGTGLLLYSFVLQAIYRYIVVIYPMRISWQTIKVQSMMICFFWLFCFTSLLPWLLTHSAVYNVDNQACILPFRLSVPIIYNVSLV
jgi:hypothetical protein